VTDDEAQTTNLFKGKKQEKIVVQHRVVGAQNWEKVELLYTDGNEEKKEVVISGSPCKVIDIRCGTKTVKT